MPPRLQILFSGLVGALLLIPALALFREFSRRPDIWWTPPPMALSLTQSRDRVEIYVRGRPLGALVEAGRLSLTEQAGPTPVEASEIGLRFNNWDRVRAERIPMMLVYAASVGGGLVLLLLTVIGGLASRREGRSVVA